MNNFRKKAVPAFVLLAGASMSLAGVTYAWFQNSNTASVSNIHIDVTGDAGGINIARTLDAATYVPDLDIGTDADKELSPVSTVNSVSASTGDKQESVFSFFSATAASSTTISKTDAATSGYLVLPVYFENLNDSTLDLYFNYAANEDIFIPKPSGNKEASQAMRVGVIKQGTFERKDKNEVYTAVSTDFHIFEIDPYSHQETAFVYKKSGEAYETTKSAYDGTDATKIQQPYWGIKKGTTFTTPVDVQYAPSHTFGDTDAQKDVMEKVTGKLQSDYNGYSSSTVTVAPEGKTKLCTLGKGYTRVDFVIWLEGQDIDCINSISADELDISLKFCSYVTPTPAGQ